MLGWGLPARPASAPLAPQKFTGGSCVVLCKYVYVGQRWIFGDKSLKIHLEAHVKDRYGVLDTYP
jgi:hypothetical protein